MKNKKELPTFLAPIKYGRISSERDCSFTMVFSSEFKAPEKLGKAKVLGFNNNPMNLKKLKSQAAELIKAEKKEAEPKAIYNWLGQSKLPDQLVDG